MPILQALSDLVNRKASRFTYTRINPEQVEDGSAVRPILSEQDYFRLWLTEMFLADDRRWFRNVYPVVHSLVNLAFGGQVREFPYVGGPLNIQEISANNLSRTISLNHQLTALLPFNGGTVELEAGLLALPGDDVVGSLLKILGDFAGLLVVPQVSAALRVAEKVAAGLQELANPAKGSLHVGLHQTFASGSGANQFCSGYHAVILAQASEIDVKKLWVISDHLRYGTSSESAVLFQGFDYMLFRIEANSLRDDWSSFTTIETPFNTAKQALSAGDEKKAGLHLQIAIDSALTSDDLTMTDQFRVAKRLKDLYDEARRILRPHSVASEGGAAEGVAPPRPVEEVGHDASPRARRGMTAGKRTSKQAESEVRASIAQVKALTQRYRGARSKKGKRMVYKAGTKKGSAKKSGRGIRFYESDLWRRPQPSPEMRQAAAGPIRLEEVMENAIPVEVAARVLRLNRGTPIAELVWSR